MPDLTGRSLDRYRILEPLGEGGMAMVYKAYDTRLEREVALKVIRRGAFPPDQLERLLRRFEREAKALGQLSQPNIVGILDYGEFEQAPYYVMEHLPGGTLKPRLGQPMPWQTAARLLLPIARALQYAHTCGILHRDVKPSNILFSASGEPMLTDFGVAKILDDEETHTQLTGTGMGVGTPEYMAPEQWTGQAVQQSDIYSLGVVFYEMVTGRKPYVADTPAGILLKQASEPLPPPGRYVPDLPAQVEQVLMHALAKKPEQRYTDMGTFAQALEALAEGKLPAEATQVRHAKLPWAWIAAGLGVLVILGGLAAGWGSRQASGSQPPIQSTEPVEAAPINTRSPTETIVPSPSDTPQPIATNTELAALPACPGPLPSRLAVGMNAQVATRGKSWQLSLRSQASKSASALHIIAEGRKMVILEGPVCAEGSYWWRVRSEQGFEGWAREGDNADYWIDPLP